MDTSVTFIKMCEKAEKIQKIHQWEVGDWSWDITNKEWNILCPACHNYEHYPMSMYIWLPRQDQLQEMVGEKSSGRLLYEFHYWYINHLVGVPIGENEKYYFLMSMEQLWLAFVMKEKYNKIWNGTDWK